MFHILDFLSLAISKDSEPYFVEHRIDRFKARLIPHPADASYYPTIEGHQDDNFSLTEEPGTDWFLRPECLDRLYDFALKEQIKSEVRILQAAYRELELEYPNQLQFYVLKNARFVERDRGAVILAFHTSSKADDPGPRSEPRLTGYMARFDGNRFTIGFVEKYTVASWRYCHVKPGSDHVLIKEFAKYLAPKEKSESELKFLK